MSTRADDVTDERAEDVFPEDGTEDVTEEADEVEADEEAPERRGPSRLVIALGVAAVVLAGLGTWFLFAANDLRSAPATRNTALVDTGRTAEVSAAVSSALNQIFSYSYDRTEETEQAAAAVLRGDALETYDKLFAQVRELAPSQKIVLTTRVVHSAVQSLEGDRARLLVFLDQAATRADADTSNAAAAQLSVTARREGGHWVITDLEPR